MLILERIVSKIATLEQDWLEHLQRPMSQIRDAVATLEREKNDFESEIEELKQRKIRLELETGALEEQLSLNLQRMESIRQENSKMEKEWEDAPLLLAKSLKDLERSKRALISARQEFLSLDKGLSTKKNDVESRLACWERSFGIRLNIQFPDTTSIKFTNICANDPEKEFYYEFRLDPTTGIPRCKLQILQMDGTLHSTHRYSIRILCAKQIASTGTSCHPPLNKAKSLLRLLEDPQDTTSWSFGRFLLSLREEFERFSRDNLDEQVGCEYLWLLEARAATKILELSHSEYLILNIS